MSKILDTQITELNNLLIEMGALIEKNISLAVDALEKHDRLLAEQSILLDDAIDRKEKDIQSLCIKLLLHHQPVAKDFRLITAVLKIITDMERIGDQASDISEITVSMKSKNKYVPEHILQMAEETKKMVSASIDAFTKNDLQLAYSVIKQDDVVDDLFMKSKCDLLKLIRTDISCDEPAMDLLMIAKYFERIGDHAVNIAKWVVFAVTGKRGRKKDCDLYCGR